MRARIVLLVVLALVPATTGCKTFAYQCASSTECSVDGQCESTGFCSFADGTCSTGRRYGEWAGGALSQTCVEGTNPDGGIDMPLDMVDAPPNAITVTFGETGTNTFSNVTFDAAFLDQDPDNYGSDNHVSVGPGASWQALFRFDLSAIPTSATVVTAKIELKTHDASLVDAPVTVHRLLETWDEAVMSYTLRDGGNAWTVPGAGAPNSRDPAVLDTFTPSTAGTFEVVLPASVVQGWVTNPSSNAGVIMETTSATHGHLSSKEHPEATKRPVFHLTYTTP